MSADGTLELRRSPLGLYRVRGRSATRLEAFSDAVFGFSATLLVVSLEVPQTFTQLAANLKGFAAFGLSFLALVFIWLAHRGFFRRYGLSDSRTTFLNMVLLFVVLFFVYPLKFMSVAVVGQLFGLSSGVEGQVPAPRFASHSEVDALFLIYGLGFAAVFLCFALMYRHARGRSADLELDTGELYDATTIFWHYMIFVLVAGVSMALTVGGFGRAMGGVAGWIYGLLGPVMTIFWIRRARRHPRRGEALAA